MTAWKTYLEDKEPSSITKSKKRRGPGCKRNKINKNKLGPCIFNEKDECVNCRRPRKKTLRLDPTTNTILVEYLE